MALGLDRRRINVKGGGQLFVREIDPTPAASLSSVGFIDSDNFIDEHSIVESVDSKGDFIDAKSGARKVTIKSVLKQTSKDEIDLMTSLALGRYYEAYYVVQLNNGSYQEFVAPVCRIIPGVNLEFKSATERHIELTIQVLAPKAALTRTPSAYNSVAWQPYALTEGVSANGAPSDAGTVPQAGI